MSGNLFDMKVMRALIKREFQEQRVLLLYIPIAIAVLIAVAFIGKLINSSQDGALWEGLGGPPRMNDGTLLSMQAFVSMPDNFQIATFNMLFSVTATLLMAFYWLGAIFYFLLTLYQSRKDRSILFWNSMPVSDAQTLISKLLTGQICGLAVFLGCLFVMHVVILLALVVMGNVQGVEGWEAFLTNSNLLSRFFAVAIGSLLALLWALPVHAWLLLTSAFSRSIPFVWGVAPFIAVLVIENYLSNDNAISAAIGSHIFPAAMVEVKMANPMVIRSIPWADLATSVGIGVVLLYAAIRFNRPDEL